jgi:pimeloyl-ACP methyl ester carboxylesterase
METRSSTGQTIPINGMEMYYETRGEGEPLVLLHGGGGIGANWDLIFSEPPGGYQVILPDLRGHGRSTNPSQGFSFKQTALDVFAMLDLLGIERFKAIGLSLGAKTLLHMATQQPSRIEAMVLVSAAPYFPEQAREIMRKFSSENRSEAEWQQMRQWHKHGDDQIRALWRMGNAFKDNYTDMNFTPPYLATINAHTLIVHGDRDPLYPVNLAIEMYEAIPRSYLWIIPNGGHGPIFGDMAEPFVKTALSFLRGEWASA